MAENLELRRDEFAQRLSDMTDCSLEEGRKEVDASIQRLFHWGAYCDKYGGSVQVKSICASNTYILNSITLLVSATLLDHSNSIFSRKKKTQIY